MKLSTIILSIGLLISACTKDKDKSENPSGVAMDMADMVHLNEQQRNIIGLKIDTAKVDLIYETSDFTGTVIADENNVSTISSRVNGRIDKLFVRNAGEEIRKGQLLYSIYSEELLSDENQYIHAISQKTEFNEQNQTLITLIEASRNRLLQWGLSEQELTELSQGKTAFATANYYSSESGFLSELNVNEGEYVEAGTPLFKLSSLNTVWIEAEVYQSELENITATGDVQVEIPSMPGKAYQGKVIQNPPALEQDRKVSSIKILLRNEDRKLKPGMMALVSFRTTGRKTLIVPKSALVLGEMVSVWVETKPGMYESRMVKTGIENKSVVEILSGLKEGDKVVSKGSYLLNSAFILQHGASSMPGMEM